MDSQKTEQNQVFIIILIHELNIVTSQIRVLASFLAPSFLFSMRADATAASNRKKLKVIKKLQPEKRRKEK
jgi:hypothetical protein